MTENGLRELALEKKIPQYPRESMRNGRTGVAVSRILVGRDGRPERVVVLEAPDAEIANEVRTALLAWRFPSDPLRRQGKLTFYFTIRDREGRVLGSDEMPRIYTPAAVTVPPGTWAEPDRSPGATEIDLPQLTGLLQTGQATILDVRSREAYESGHSRDSINIPLDELGQRGPLELSRSKTLVLECSTSNARLCREGGRVLRRAGFANVAVYLDSPINRS